MEDFSMNEQNVSLEQLNELLAPMSLVAVEQYATHVIALKSPKSDICLHAFYVPGTKHSKWYDSHESWRSCESLIADIADIDHFFGIDLITGPWTKKNIYAGCKSLEEMHIKRDLIQ